MHGHSIPSHLAGTPYETNIPACTISLRTSSYSRPLNDAGTPRQPTEQHDTRREHILHAIRRTLTLLRTYWYKTGHWKQTTQASICQTCTHAKPILHRPSSHESWTISLQKLGKVYICDIYIRRIRENKKINKDALYNNELLTHIVRENKPDAHEVILQLVAQSGETQALHSHESHTNCLTQGFPNQNVVKNMLPKTWSILLAVSCFCRFYKKKRFLFNYWIIENSQYLNNIKIHYWIKII